MNKMNDPTIISIDKLGLVNIRDEQHNTVASFYGCPIAYNVRSMTNGYMQIEVCYNVQTKNFSMNRLTDAVLAGTNRDIDEDELEAD